jgi:rubrerythrin
MTNQEAMKLALEALKNIVNAVYVNSQQEADAVYKANDAIKAIEEALKQEQNFCSRCGKRTSDLNDIHTCTPSKQERGKPVRGVYWKCVLCGFAHIEDECPECGHHTRAEFDFPQSAQKPLTEEQIKKASLEAGMQEHYMGFHSGFIKFARAIEAAIKE